MEAVKSRQVINSDYSALPLIVNYYTRQLLEKITSQFFLLAAE